MTLFLTSRRMLAAATIAAAATGPAQAAPDLLVAPTRVVLEGQRGAEVILNNTGDAPETYRISLELKRMAPDGQLETIAEDMANPAERQALDMISYAPRRVTLAPNQPQAIRIGVRPPAGLPDGEYRAHLLFRGLPDTKSVTEIPPAQANGVAIRLTPIYGLSIPIIVRHGRLEGAARIGDVALANTADGKALTIHLTRTGERSTYGQLRVRRAGSDEPVALANGIAIYPELTDRDFTLELEPGQPVPAGSVTVDYLESRDGELSLVASKAVTLR